MALINRTNIRWIVLALLLVALGVTCRLLPHTPNVSPAMAIALFAGMIFPSRKIALAVVMVMMAVSDSRIGSYDWPIMAVVYLSLFVPFAFRGWLQTKLSPWRVLTAAFASSVTFAILTNFATWLVWYPQTWEGAVECYWAALPFFRWSLEGDLCWSIGLFGAYAIVLRAHERLRDSRIVEA